MKRLYLLRSTRHRTVDSPLSDYHRPLTRRGEIAAMTVGKAMHKNGYIPDLVICATITRARQTLSNMWPYLMDSGGKAPGLVYDYRIHMVRGDAMLQRLHEVDAEVESLLMVSIAPGISDLARLLHSGNMDTPDPFARDLPMGGLAIFDCNADDWATVAPACGTLINILN